MPHEMARFQDHIESSCMDAHGPRLIATVWGFWFGGHDCGRTSGFLERTGMSVAASPDGFPRASSSMLARHRRSPCRSTHQAREEMGSIPFTISARLLQCSRYCLRLEQLVAVRSARRDGFLGPVFLLSSQNRPDDPGVLVREGDGDHVGMSPCTHPADPQTFRIGLPVGLAEHGARAMDHQRSDVAVSAFADPEQPGLAAA